MNSLESVFVKEFRHSVSNVGYKDIYKIPLPEECSRWGVSGADMFLVKGVPDEETPYCKLNGTLVKRLPSGTVAKRRVIDKATRGFKRTETDEYVYEDYTVPSGSIVVLSSQNIGVLYKAYKKPTETGYGYIDFVDSGKGREYMYVIPKTVLYEVHQTALALSVTNMKNYSGSGYVTWDSGVIYLHVIPYNPRSKYVGSKVLATKVGLDYSEEVTKILSYWQRNGVIPDLKLCVLEDGSNLALKPTSVGYTEYAQVELLALGDKDIYGSSEVEDDAKDGSNG